MLKSLSKILRNMLTTNNNILLVLLNYDNSKTFPKLSVMYDVNLNFLQFLIVNLVLFYSFKIVEVEK
jgi:hypothetical protein